MEYKVSPDIREKEKIVGGHFTATQTVFLGLAVLCGIGLGLLTFQTLGNIPIAVIMVILGALPFAPFAFIKVEKMGDMELFFYLLIRLKYINGQKVYLNLNENQRNRLLREAKNESIS